MPLESGVTLRRVGGSPFAWGVAVDPSDRFENFRGRMRTCVIERHARGVLLGPAADLVSGSFP